MRVGGWARRFFAPMLTAGAALALVGVVGTTVPLLGGAQSGAAPAALEQAETDGTTNRDNPNPAGGAAASEEPGTLDYGSEAAPSDAELGPALEPLHSDAEAPVAADNSGSDLEPIGLTDERPIWPMLLFAGVALMIAAALLRWILAPRAG